MNFPSRHPLNHSRRRAAIVAGRCHPRPGDERFLGLAELLQRPHRAHLALDLKTGAKIFTLGSRDLYMKANYQDFGRYQEVDLAIAGDAEATLPALIEAVRRLVDGGRKAAFEARGKKLAAAKLGRVRAGASPMRRSAGTRARSRRRACAWRSTTRSRTRIGRWSAPRSDSNWPHRLWNFDKPYQLERRLGRRRHRLYAAGLARRRARQQAAMAGSRWRSAATATSCSCPARCGPPRTTAFRCSTSCTTIAPITRSTCTCRRWPARRRRGITDADIGTTLKDPDIDYATVAQGFGVHGEGPITDPNELAPALKRAHRGRQDAASRRWSMS